MIGMPSKRAKGVKIDDDRLTAELPLLMLYSLSYAGGNKAPHEALGDIHKDRYLSEIFREISKISYVYQRLVKKYGSTLLALEKAAESVSSLIFPRIIRSYIASYMLRGSPLDTLYQLALVSAESFEHRLKERLDALMHGVELIATATVIVLLTVVLSSSFSSNYVASYLASLIVIGISFAIAITTRIRVLSVILPRQTSLLADTVLSFIAATSLLLLILDKYIYALALACLVTPVYVYNIATMRKAVLRLSRLTYTMRVVTEALTLRLSNIDTIISMIKTGDGDERSLIYALRTGRAAPSNIEKWPLVYLLSKTVSSIVRSGSNAAKISRIANTVLESLSLNMRVLFGKVLVMMIMLPMVIVAIAASMVYASKMFQTSYASAPHVMLPYTALSIDSELAIKSIAISGVGASFAITYAVWGALAYNLAAPLVVIGTSMIMLLS
ncbi:hypothetical protein [Pyrodictium abyssi]|uniref:Type II secretion system protein GspF domain-containing protein n=1 Tax=Pyrodictium abyssi TaxID=54256 RepID=A0ABM8IX41_9CREN|nr:hypothetical protein PABY_16850 [Pyrodictium abyssi]